MKTPSWFCVVLPVLLMFPTRMKAGSLDAPSGKGATVRSEIRRGFETALTCSAKSGVKGYAKEIAEAAGKTDSPGFLLGLNFEAWQIQWLVLSKSLYNPDDTKLVRTWAETYWNLFKAWQTKLD